VSLRFVDESDGVIGWVEDARIQRTSHALAADGRVWLIDPIDGAGVEERVRELGEPGGVIQLLDRHSRDGAELAGRLGVPLHVLPDQVDGTTFRFLPVVRSRWWREVALWWPERRILVCADALGTIGYFRVGEERAGVHPLLRFRPPRALVGLGVEQLLVGHGEGLRGDGTTDVVDDAIRHARRRIPRWLLQLPRLLRS
jgi:hypothetical protein